MIRDWRYPLMLHPFPSLKAHCYRHIAADTNVFPFTRARNICCGHEFWVRDTQNVSDFVQKHFVSATNVSQFAQPKKHHGQQYVHNNVSSFTRAFKDTTHVTCLHCSQPCISSYFIRLLNVRMKSREYWTQTLPPPLRVSKSLRSLFHPHPRVLRARSAGFLFGMRKLRRGFEQSISVRNI